MNKNDDPHRYDDIIDLPHHVSSSHPPMPLRDRAAQFAPFAALAGYGAVINETARFTESRPELEEEQLDILNTKMAQLQEHLKEKPEITFSCFRPDGKKSGGSFEVITGTVRKADQYEGTITFTDGRKIRIENILDMEGNIFSQDDFA
ncbi:MAG: YolD-like family protein [Clostridiaceae bacterium]|nr:YolD-like family protein [Clostridiaceae bacterium]